MIVATHTVIYSDNAEATRTFFRDILGLANVDAREGWLIFQLPPAELGVHPTAEAVPAGGAHQIFLMCDDIIATVAELAAKGVQFASPVEEAGFGRVTTMKVPGAGTLGLYQPSHATAYHLTES